MTFSTIPILLMTHLSKTRKFVTTSWIWRVFFVRIVTKPTLWLLYLTSPFFLNSSFKKTAAFLKRSPFSSCLLQPIAWIYMQTGERFARYYHPAIYNKPNLKIFDRAISCYSVAIICCPNNFKIQNIEAHIKISHLYDMKAQIDTAGQFFQKAEKLQNELAQSHPLGRSGVRFLSTGTGILSQIGHLSMEPDYFIKARTLGWLPDYDPLLLAPRIMNPCLLNYWRKYISVITDPKISQNLTHLRKILERDHTYVTFPNGKVTHLCGARNAVQAEWEARNLPPLLALTQEHHERGWQALQSLGMPKDAWFVCLHVRESNSQDESNNSLNAMRNGDIITYFSAVRAIVARGGWVIRMGDPNMKPLPAMDQVIDYAHSNIRSDWMDVFCCSECLFFIGTSSGLFNVAYNFGAPILGTNIAPLIAAPPQGKDLFIPKLYWSEKEKCLLNFSKTLAPSFSYCTNNWVLQERGIRLIDNTQDEIKYASMEMLDRLQGKLVYSEEDENLQEKYRNLVKLNETYGVAYRIGRDFLRKYSYLLN